MPTLAERQNPNRVETTLLIADLIEQQKDIAAEESGLKSGMKSGLKTGNDAESGMKSGMKNGKEAESGMKSGMKNEKEAESSMNILLTANGY